MADVKWTKEQQDAIYDKGSNILVAAAAGSGKTAVLVERIINKVINENVDIDKILVVTFTNAAASEMRERILEAIYNFSFVCIHLSTISSWAFNKFSAPTLTAKHPLAIIMDVLTSLISVVFSIIPTFNATSFIVSVTFIINTSFLCYKI